MMIKKHLRALISALLISIVLLVCQSAQAQEKPSISDAAASWVESAEFKSLVADPSPIFRQIASGTEEREWTINHLPLEIRNARVTDPAVILKAAARLCPLLSHYAGARQLELFIFKSESPYIALGDTSLIVISTEALDLFNDSELRAAAAHELAHLYFFDEYLADYLARDFEKIRLIELKADALGTALSVGIGERPDTLIRAIRRHLAYLEKHHFIDTAHIELNPTLGEREALYKLVSSSVERPCAIVKR